MLIRMMNSNIPLNLTLHIHLVIHSTVYQGRMLIQRMNKNFLKMCGGKINFNYLYIK